MDVAIMIEGQDGLNWPRWQRIGLAVEALGFAGLYRSDHFTNPEAPDKDSLELWLSLTWLASHTQRIEFGPLVTPVSFRHPVFTARIGAQLDDLAGGRLVLGVGAGWEEREHTAFGFDLLALAERMQRFEESLEVISRLLHSDTPVSLPGPLLSVARGRAAAAPAASRRPAAADRRQRRPAHPAAGGPLRRRVERRLYPRAPLRRAHCPAGQPAGRAGTSGWRCPPVVDDRPGLWAGRGRATRQARWSRSSMHYASTA